MVVYSSIPLKLRRGGWGHLNQGRRGVAWHPRGVFSINDCGGGAAHLEAWGRGVEFESGENGKGSSNVQADEVTEDWGLEENKMDNYGEEHKMVEEENIEEAGEGKEEEAQVVTPPQTEKRGSRSKFRNLKWSI